jgi:hypothetical protein
MTATHEVNCTTPNSRLHLAFELGWSQWKLAFTIGHTCVVPWYRHLPRRRG